METITAKGVNGTATFDGTFVRIERTGAMARATVGKGTKSIPVSHITGVEWKQPSLLVRGFVAFEQYDAQQSRVGRRTLDATTKENAVIIKRSQVPQWRQLVSAVERAMTMHRAGGN